MTRLAVAITLILTAAFAVGLHFVLKAGVEALDKAAPEALTVLVGLMFGFGIGLALGDWLGSRRELRKQADVGARQQPLDREVDRLLVGRPEGRNFLAGPRD